MPGQAHAVIPSDGFRGHGCLFCNSPIAPGNIKDELELRVRGGHAEPRFWAHRQCFRNAIHPMVRAMIDGAADKTDRFDILPPPA
jgi:hypothetical protein